MKKYLFIGLLGLCCSGCFFVFGIGKMEFHVNDADTVKTKDASVLPINAGDVPIKEALKTTPGGAASGVAGAAAAVVDEVNK